MNQDLFVVFKDLGQSCVHCWADSTKVGTRTKVWPNYHWPVLTMATKNNQCLQIIKLSKN